MQVFFLSLLACRRLRISQLYTKSVYDSKKRQTAALRRTKAFCSVPNMISSIFLPEIVEESLQNIWLQQDAPPLRVTIEGSLRSAAVLQAT